MEERGETARTMETHQQLIKILEAVNAISRDSQLSHDSPGSDSSAIKALPELRKASGAILSSNSSLPFSLSQHLSRLADSVQDLYNCKPSKHSSLISFVTRRVRSHEVSRLAAAAESELNALIDRETVPNLSKTLTAMRYFSETVDEAKLLDEMSALQTRLSLGFNINLQDLLLKSGIFAGLEWVLCNPNFKIRVREKAAISMKELVLFNKDVFVGSVLIGGSVKSLVSMDSLCSLQILSALIKAIKSPLVDVMEYSGGVSKIVGHLSSEKLEIRVTAMDCVMEIGYFGRKEAIETMINGGLVHKLVELQSWELREVGEESDYREMKRPFWRCVARFAVQLEVGEGLRQREKRAFKQIVLKKVREACFSDAESATIVAEVLWGSSP